MKLRNKKTGRIVNFRHIAFDEPKDDTENYRYSSLAEFNDEWEDVTEPLIKDEKVRKAVRAWAEANGETMAKVKGACLVTVFKGLHKQLDLELNCSWTRDGIYTIAELCGEEEE